MTSCLMTYPTVEEQSAAILASKLLFQVQLDTYLAAAYKVGKKLAMKKADWKDTQAYVTP